MRTPTTTCAALLASIVSCASQPTTTPGVETTPTRTGPANLTPTTGDAPPRATPQLFTEVATRVDHAMVRAHGLAWTHQSFVAPRTVPPVIGTVTRKDGAMHFVSRGETLGTARITEKPCGPDVLNVRWLDLDVGAPTASLSIVAEPQWWQLDSEVGWARPGFIRVGATELVAVAHNRVRGCHVYAVIADGTPRFDVDQTRDGASGPTESKDADVFGRSGTLDVTTDAVAFRDDVVRTELEPTFEATCAFTRWGRDELDRFVLRAKFSDGAQAPDCDGGGTTEEFIELRAPNGDLVRAHRIRRMPTGGDQTDYVVDKLGDVTLVYEGGTTETSSTTDEGCAESTRSTTGLWIVRAPSSPEISAVGRRTYRRSCSPEGVVPVVEQ